VKIRPYMLVSSLAAAGLLTAACGQSPAANPNTVAKIAPRMEAAMRAAQSVHMVGSVDENSQQITMDVSFQGGGMSGTVSAAGQTVNLVLLAGKAYVKVDQAFLKEAGLPASDCSSMCGRYLAVPSSQLGQAGSLTLSSLMSQMLSKIPSVNNDTSEVFVRSTLNGQPVLKGSGDGVTLEVAGSGPPYPLLITQAGQGTVAFSEWNAVPPITPPPASDIITP
jgi:ribosomal protein S9